MEQVIILDHSVTYLYRSMLRSSTALTIPLNSSMSGVSWPIRFSSNTAITNSLRVDNRWWNLPRVICVEQLIGVEIMINIFAILYESIKYTFINNMYLDELWKSFLLDPLSKIGAIISWYISNVVRIFFIWSYLIICEKLCHFRAKIVRIQGIRIRVNPN